MRLKRIIVEVLGPCGVEIRSRHTSVWAYACIYIYVCIYLRVYIYRYIYTYNWHAETLQARRRHGEWPFYTCTRLGVCTKIFFCFLPCLSYCLCILCLIVFAVRCFTTLYKFMEDRPHVPVQNAFAVLGRRLRKRAGVFDDGEVTQRLVKNNRMAYTVLCLFVQARVLSDTVGGQGSNSRNHRARRQGSDNAQMLKTFAGPECGIEVHVYICIYIYRYL